ncbi:MAG: enoyl-CoA hydratase [Acetobacteraceae bacterium]
MTVRIDHDGRGIATITVDRAAKLNALNSEMVEALASAATSVGQEAGLRAVVLRGAGTRAFIGGADIAEMGALADAAAARAFITRVHRACDALRRIPVPVIARVQGYALGAGLEIAASCDLRVASEGASFGMPEVRIGLPSVVEAALLPGLIGWGRARRLLLTGETIDAARALAWGLVEEVVADAALDAAVERVLASVLASAPNAVRLQKELVGAWEDLPLREAVQRGIDVFERAWRTEEPRRTIADFLDAERRRKGPCPTG